MDNKIDGLLGICRRAGHLTTGFDAVKASVLQGHTRLVLFAADVSEKTAKEIRFAAGERSLATAKLSLDKAALAAVLGLQKPVGVIATDDRGFATAMQKHIPAELKEDDAL